MFKWTRGRQNSGYEKMKLVGASFIPFDLYLIRYHEGDSIPEHTDPVKKGLAHHRLNIIFKQCDEGGELFIEDKQVNKRVVYFRPDKQKHYVKEIKKGSRYILSLGWVTREKQ